MPVHKRPGSPFWHYSFSVNGMRFRGSTGKTSKNEAKIVEAEKRHAAKLSALPRDNWTLHHCLGVYWSERAQYNRSSKIILGLLYRLRQHLGENTPIMALTNPMLMDYRAARRGEASRDPKRRDIAAPTINRDFACLKAALNHARQIHGQQIPALAWSHVKVPESPHRIRFLSYDEYDRLLSVADEAMQKLIKVAVATGLRKDNLLSLDWSQVDLSSARITVTLKGNKLHSIRMPPETRAALATDTRRKGKVFDTTNFRRRWDKAVEAAGLADFRFHDLRHTCASWARMEGADLADICEALGHSNIAVTMRYAHIEPEHHLTAFDRISQRVWARSQTRKGVKSL